MSRYDHGDIDWVDLFDDYGTRLIDELGYNLSHSLSAHIRNELENPVVASLRQDPIGFVKAAERAGNGTVNMDGVSRAEILCQMMLYDAQGGPEGDWKEKASRRHWYAHFKSFAQMLAFALGKVRANDQGIDEMNDLQWTGRISKCYGGFVDSNKVTYKDLWVEDASRMMTAFGTYDLLIPKYNLIIAVEKDSLFDDFEQAARAVGAVALVSGKGKMGKAATERLLRKLGWQEDNNPFEGVVSVITLSDHDYDGHGVIMPTFAEQARRYLSTVYEERVGVMPHQVEEVVGKESTWDSSYQIKVKDEGYRKWADQHALFWCQCINCGHMQYSIGLADIEYDEEVVILKSGREKVVQKAISAYGADKCSICNSELEVDMSSFDEPHGFEVESLRSSDYYRAIVRAILRQIEFDYIIERLRENAKPSIYDITNSIASKYLEDNDRYTKIKNAISVLEEAKNNLVAELEKAIQDPARELIEDLEDEWKALGDDPTPEDFEDYVVQAGRSGYGSVYRPFSIDERSKLITERLEEDSDLEEELKSIDVEDFEDVVTEVIDILR